MLRVPGEQSLYGVSPDRSLAGLMPSSPRSQTTCVWSSPRRPMISGRVIDSNGTPQAARTVIVQDR